jgi:hypothetical protein
MTTQLPTKALAAAALLCAVLPAQTFGARSKFRLINTIPGQVADTVFDSGWQPAPTVLTNGHNVSSP